VSPSGRHRNRRTVRVVSERKPDAGFKRSKAPLRHPIGGRLVMVAGARRLLVVGAAGNEIPCSGKDATEG